MSPETREIIDLYNNGIAVAEIQRRTGYSVARITNAVGAARKRGDVTRYNGRKLSASAKKRHNDVVKHVAKGMKYRDVSTKLGVPMGSVAAIVSKARDRGELPPVTPRKDTYMRYYVRTKNQRFGRVSKAASTLSPDAARWLVDRTVAGGYDTIAEMMIDEMLEIYTEEQHQ